MPLAGRAALVRVSGSTAGWLLELFIVAFESLPLVAYPQNLLKDAHFSVDGVGAYLGAPHPLIHPDRSAVGSLFYVRYV